MLIKPKPKLLYDYLETKEFFASRGIDVSEFGNTVEWKYMPAKDSAIAFEYDWISGDDPESLEKIFNHYIAHFGSDGYVWLYNWRPDNLLNIRKKHAG